MHAPPPVSISKTAPNMLPQTPLWNRTQTTTPDTKNAPPKKRRRADGIKGVGEEYEEYFSSAGGTPFSTPPPAGQTSINNYLVKAGSEPITAQNNKDSNNNTDPVLPGGVSTKTSRNESNAATNKVSSSSSVKETAENEDVISMIAHNMQMIQIQKLYFGELQQQQQITADLTEENKKLCAENIALKDQTMSLSQKLMCI